MFLDYFVIKRAMFYINEKRKPKLPLFLCAVLQIEEECKISFNSKNYAKILATTPAPTVRPPS
ncbi:hypothetical protein K6U52_13130, partial [Vibrio vulnificus]|uniref:hypothetical protein n=1 Tax=Vibrio vulnificus TaxID=672 RepID=UPI001EE9EF87